MNYLFIQTTHIFSTWISKIQNQKIWKLSSSETPLVTNVKCLTEEGLEGLTKEEF